MFWTLTKDLGGSAARPWSFNGSIRRCRSLRARLRRTTMDLLLDDIIDDKRAADDYMLRYEQGIVAQMIGSIDVTDKERIREIFGNDFLWRKDKFLQDSASGYLYLNCYALAACFTFDIWFTEVLHDVFEIDPGLLGSGPEREGWYGSPKTWYQGQIPFFMITEHLPPLFHAIVHGNFHQARQLMKYGASLDEVVCRGQTVLSRVLHETSIREDALQFLFQWDSLLQSPLMNHSLQHLNNIKNALGGRGAIELLDHSFLKPTGTCLPGNYFVTCHRLLLAREWKRLVSRLLPVLFPFGSLSVWLIHHTPIANTLLLMGSYFGLNPESISTRFLLIKSEESASELSRYWVFLMRNIFDNPQLSVNNRFVYRNSLQSSSSRSSLLRAYLIQYNLRQYDLIIGISTPLIFWPRSQFAETQEELGLCPDSPLAFQIQDCRRKWADSAMAWIRNRYMQLLDVQLAPDAFVPTIHELVFCGDLDWLKWNSDHTTTLRKLGYRHSLMFYAEVQIVLIVIFFVVLTNLSLGVRKAITCIFSPGGCIPIVGSEAVLHKSGYLLPHDYLLLIFWVTMFFQWDIPIQTYSLFIGPASLIVTAGVACFDGCMYDHERFFFYTLFRKPYGRRYTGYAPAIIVKSVLRAFKLGFVFDALSPPLSRLGKRVWAFERAVSEEPDEEVLEDEHEENNTASRPGTDRQARANFRMEQGEGQQVRRDVERQREEGDRRIERALARIRSDTIKMAKGVVSACVTVLSWPIILADWANKREARRLGATREQYEPEGGYFDELASENDWEPYTDG